MSRTADPEAPLRAASLRSARVVDTRMLLTVRFAPETNERCLVLCPELDATSRDLVVAVDLRLPTLSARTSVWIHRDDWDGFIDALDSLERTRSGEARLTAMSPGELDLVVRVLDRAGHVGVEGLVGEGGQDAWYVGFSVFAIDPTSLPALVREGRRGR